MPLDLDATVEGLHKVATEIKSELTKVKSESEKSSAEWNAKLDKMIADITEKHDKIQAETKATDDRAARIEAMLERGEIKADKSKNTESKQKFNQFLRDVKAGATELEIRAMSTDNNLDGGFLVYPELADFIAGRDFETSPLRRVARVMQTSREAVEVIVDDNEAGARWAGEGLSGGETTTPQIGKITINTFKLEADPRQTVEMIQDAVWDVEAWLQTKVADKFTRTENTAFVAGTGVNQPRGFMTFANWASAGVYQRDAIERFDVGSATAYDPDQLIDMQAGLKEVYQPNAVWMTKRASYGAILKLKGADNYFFSPTLLKDGQPLLTLLGKPVVFADDIAAIGANALSIAYGDFSVGYTIVDRVGITVLRDPYTAKGFVTYYTTKRTGGAVTNYEAIKIGHHV